MKISFSCIHSTQIKITLQKKTMIKNDFTSIFGETPIWHLCTDGQSQCIIFRNGEEFKEGMNLVGLCLAKYSKISSLTFSLMNNHMHFLIQGEREDIETFYNYLYGKLRRMLLRQNRRSDMPKPRYSMIQITSDSHLKNTIAYINRNGYVTNPNFTPFSYEWGAARYFFNSTHTNEEKKFLKEMFKREQMNLFHTHDIDFPSNYYLTNGYISPLCYCKITECEMMFRNAHQYCWLITRNVESFKQIADLVGDKIFYTDEELYTAMLQFTNKQFKNIKINTLNKDEKIQTAKHLHFSFNASARQISRILKIQEELLNKLFPKSK